MWVLKERIAYILLNVCKYKFKAVGAELMGAALKQIKRRITMNLLCRHGKIDCID